MYIQSARINGRSQRRGEVLHSYNFQKVRRSTIVTPISHLTVLVSFGAKKSKLFFVSRMYLLVCLQKIAYPRLVGISHEAVKRIICEGLHPYVHARTS